MIVEHSAAAGATRRPMGADEVLDRCLLPLSTRCVPTDRPLARSPRAPPPPVPTPRPSIPQGFKILEEDRAARVGHRRRLPLRLRLPALARRADALGAPRRDGGLPKLVADLRRYAEAYPQVAHWKPSELLVREAGAASKL